MLALSQASQDPEPISRDSTEHSRLAGDLWRRFLRKWGSFWMNPRMTKTFGGKGGGGDHLGVISGSVERNGCPLPPFG